VRLRRKFKSNLGCCDVVDLFLLLRVEEEGVVGSLSFFRCLGCCAVSMSFTLTDAWCSISLLLLLLLDVSIVLWRNDVLGCKEHMLEMENASAPINRAVTTSTSNPVIAFILFIGVSFFVSYYTVVSSSSFFGVI